MRIRIRRSLVIATALSAGLFIASCSEGVTPDGATVGADSDTAKLLLTTSTWNISYAPFVVAEEMNYFEDEGINVEYVLLKGSSTVYQQLSQGHGDLAVMSPEPVVIGKDRGENEDLMYFSSYYRESIWGLGVPADSPIQSVEDLEGKKIGVASVESGGVYAAKSVLKDAGIDPDLGVSYLAIGNGAQALTAVESGEVEALSLFDAEYAGLENGGIELRMLDTPKLNALTSGGLVAKNDRLENNRELLIKVARGVAKASLFTATNPEAAVRIVWDKHPETKPQGMDESEAMDRSLRVLEARMDNVKLKEGDDTWGLMSEQAWSDFVDFTRDAGMIKGDVEPADLFTTDLIEEINDFDAAAVEAEAKDYSP